MLLIHITDWLNIFLNITSEAFFAQRQIEICLSSSIWGKKSNNLWKTASTVAEMWLMGIFDTDKTELIPLRFCFIFWVSEATHTRMRKAQRLRLLQSSRLNKNVIPASPPLSSVSVSVVFSFNLYLLALLCLTASTAHFSSDIFSLKASALIWTTFGFIGM